VTSHPYGISKLTAAHSAELLSDGHRRQLASTAPGQPGWAVSAPGRLVRGSVSRILALASAVCVRMKSAATKGWGFAPQPVSRPSGRAEPLLVVHERAAAKSR
jgi:hypothetical protein